MKVKIPYGSYYSNPLESYYFIEHLIYEMFFFSIFIILGLYKPFAAEPLSKYIFKNQGDKSI